MSSLPITEKFLAACQEYRVKLDRLERENAALRKDKERLDWLEECHAWPEYIDAEWHVVGEVFSSYRAAIDAARKMAEAIARPEETKP